jgi:hypothetical protein
MKITIGTPWRETPERKPAYDFMQQWWGSVLFGMGCQVDADFVSVDTDDEIFNLNACRNGIVEHAALVEADVVVICDADVVMSNRPMTSNVIQIAAQSDELHMPFTLQRYLTADETRGVISGHPSCGDLPGVGVGNGCCYICRPEVWEQFGGGDPNFVGWGGDDDQIVACASTLVGLRRYTPVAWSMHHADECRPIGSPMQQRNARRAQRYWSAAGNQRAIRRLIDTRDEEWDQ